MPPTSYISLAALLVAIIALWNTYRSTKRQELIAKRRYVADLHEKWWSEDMAKKRYLVWTELEKWKELKNNSPAIKHFSKTEEIWSLDSDVLRAHARILFFFSDLNRLIEHQIIDESMTLEIFGVPQYDWFRPYFQAIRLAVKQIEPDKDRQPRYIDETQSFEQKLDSWKYRKSSKKWGLNL
jgi:hypothetical protein